MPTPVTVVASGGSPVTELDSAGGAGPKGAPVTQVSSGGIPVTLVSNGTPVTFVNNDLSDQTPS